MSIKRESETSWEMVTSHGERNEYDSITATASGLEIGYCGEISWSELDKARALVAGVTPAPAPNDDVPTTLWQATHGATERLIAKEEAVAFKQEMHAKFVAEQLKFMREMRDQYPMGCEPRYTMNEVCDRMDFLCSQLLKPAPISNRSAQSKMPGTVSYLIDQLQAAPQNAIALVDGWDLGEVEIDLVNDTVTIYGKDRQIAGPPAPTLDELKKVSAELIKNATNHLASAMPFDVWWKDNAQRYIDDSLHMSDCHMASVVWDAALNAKSQPMDGLTGDNTGTRSVRDATAFMIENKTDVLEMFYQHEGKRINVELRILKVGDAL